MVIFSKSPINSVLYLISVYITTSLLFFVLGAELMAILLILIYVGAVAILFIFVIIMLNQRLVETYNTIKKHFPFGLAISFFFLIEILYMIKTDFQFSSVYF
jgi:NADH-quinone oxidoreductase subunit J